MNELKFIHFNNFSDFAKQKISVNPSNTEYVIYSLDDRSNIVASEVQEGTPTISYYSIVFVKDLSLLYTHGKIMQSTDSSNFITYEEFSQVSTSALNSIQKGTLGTINGSSLEDGDITFDLSLLRIVSTLPTENIENNKIYLIRDNSITTGNNVFNEYVYNDSVEPGSWEMIGQISTEIDLSDYIKTKDADKRYILKSANTSNSMTTSNNGALSNFSDNGQAYLAVRPKTPKFLINIPYAAAAFGVKDDGTAAFSHKTYTSYTKDTGAYQGAKNTAVLQFAGPVGLRYAKNTGSGTDVTEDMYKYVGVIDSPDEFQRVYSAKQVDELLRTISGTISELQQRIEELENKDEELS